MVTQAFQDELEVLHVFLTTGTGDEEVVYIYVAEVEATQNFIHEPLECLGCIPDSRGSRGSFARSSISSIASSIRSLRRLSGKRRSKGKESHLVPPEFVPMKVTPL